MKTESSSRQKYYDRDPRARWHDPFNKIGKRLRNPRILKSYPLTPRKKLILHLYNVGLKTPEIAELVGIAVPTVYRHLDRIFWKLEVNRVRDAIRKGICEK